MGHLGSDTGRVGPTFHDEAVWVLGMVAVMDRENWVIVLVSVETGGGVLITSLTSRRSSDPSPNNGQLHLRGASAAPPTAEQSPEAERLPVGCLRICRDPGLWGFGGFGGRGLWATSNLQVSREIVWQTFERQLLGGKLLR